MVDVSVAAGSVATVLFAVSTLPMLVKARRTKDVRSYSLANIALGNIGNLLYTVYVLHLPMGPIWALHAFHTVSTALMLYWYVRYVLIAQRRAAPAAGSLHGWHPRSSRRSTRPVAGSGYGPVSWSRARRWWSSPWGTPAW